MYDFVLPLGIELCNRNIFYLVQPPKKNAHESLEAAVDGANLSRLTQSSETYTRNCLAPPCMPRTPGSSMCLGPSQINTPVSRPKRESSLNRSEVQDGFARRWNYHAQSMTPLGRYERAGNAAGHFCPSECTGFTSLLLLLSRHLPIQPP